MVNSNAAINEIRRTRRAVKRPKAETYILISLTAFGVTVVVTRTFLELAGYPQVGNSVLHIAHAIWGGLLLFVASLLPLVLTNRWVYTASAVLSGIGIGLFIDEVGKFITQKNDYFFAPAAPLIYSLFLLMVLMFLLLRGRRSPDPRASLYRALLGLHETLDNDLDPRERDHLLADLAIAQTASDPHITLLADRLTSYIQDESIPLSTYRPGFWTRLGQRVRAIGDIIGRKNHRRLIVVIMALMSLEALLAAVLLVIVWLSPEVNFRGMLTLFVSSGQIPGQNPILPPLRFALKLMVAGLCVPATVLLLLKRDEAGINFALLAATLSLTAVHILTFYVNQFRSLWVLFANLALLLILLAYRSWYLGSTTTGDTES